MKSFVNFRMSTAFFLLSIVIYPANVFTQGDDANKFQRDFMQIIDVLKKNHPGIPEIPLQMLPENVFEKEGQGVYEKLKNVTDVKDFYFIVTGFLAKLNDGHTRLFYSAGASRYLPLGLNWFGDRLYVTGAWDERYKFVQHKEIISISKIPVLELEKMVNSNLPTDRDNIFHLRKEMFGNTFFMVNEDMLRHLKVTMKDEVPVEYRDKEDIKATHVAFIRLTSEPDYDPFVRNEITRCRNENFYSIHEDLSTAYSQFSDLQKELTSSFYEEMFTKIKEHNIRFLVLDLRNASGGNVESMLEIFRYMIDEPKDCTLYKSWTRNGVKNELQFGGTHTIDPAQKELRFNGRLIVFIGKTTYSAGTFPVVMVKDNNFGLLLGEPCGNNSIRYGEHDRIKLPSTGMTFQYSTCIWERARPGAVESQQFIEPDILIIPSIEDYIQKRDPVWDYFVQNYALKNRN